MISEGFYYIQIITKAASIITKNHLPEYYYIEIKIKFMLHQYMPMSKYLTMIRIFSIFKVFFLFNLQFYLLFILGHYKLLYNIKIILYYNNKTYKIFDFLIILLNNNKTH